MAIKKVKFEDIKKSRGRTKKEDLDKITDKDIAESVLSDEDAVIPSDDELKEFKKPKERKGNEKNS